MIRSLLPPRRPHLVALVLMAAMPCWSEVADAQSTATQPLVEPAPPGDTIRLTDEEREAALEKNTVESAAAARGEMAGPDRVRPAVHGEVGAMVGSNGMRGVYGTAAVPLGDHAGAVVSFDSEQFGHRR